MTAVRYGVFIFPTPEVIRPDSLAREVEARGFESLWFPEHSHIPASRLTPWGGRPGAPPLPAHYWHSYDQFVALAYAASVTSDLKLGTGITLMAQRDPIWTAKEVATLDHLSGGRVIFGVGYGWNKEEMAQHGVAYSQRRAVMREKIAMMKAIWTQDEASYVGKLMSLEPSWAFPKPIQKPHPPILMGAAPGPKTIVDMVDYCDGWIPLAGRHDIAAHVAAVRTAMTEAGRDATAFDVTAYGAKMEWVEELDSAGVDRVVFNLPSSGPDTILPILDDWANALNIKR